MGRAGKTTYCLEHSSIVGRATSGETRYEVYDQLAAAISHAPQAIIYNSYRARDMHEAHGYSNSRSIVIPNGFDTQKWRPDPSQRKKWRAKLQFDPDEVVLIYIGRFHPMKDIPTFLEACDRALNDNPDLRVVMVGEALDENNPAIIDAIAPNKRARFRLLGRRPDVEAILPACDLFCLSSTSEAFPNVLGEAMAAGLPCIATDVGDCSILMAGAGIIIPPRDAAQMAEEIGKIVRMSLASRHEIGEAARARIATAYNLHSTVNAYATLYDKITKRDG